MKYIIKLASYKNSKSFFGGLIRFKQRFFDKLPLKYSRFSHSEIVFKYIDDKDVLEIIEKIEFIRNQNELFNNRKGDFIENNLWFSSEEGTGSRFKFIEDNKDHWVFTEFEVSKENYIALLNKAIKEDNNAYNWNGIFWKQFLGVNWFMRERDWFCSQISGRLLQELNGKDRIDILVGKDAININPGKLAFLVDNF